MEGGIDAWEDRPATGAPEQGMAFLEDISEAPEALAFAAALEESAVEFYAAARDVTIGQEERNLFSRLSSDEEGHAALLHAACRRLYDTESCGGFPIEGDRRRLMEGAVALDELLEWTREPGRSTSDILDTAMQLEANSLDFYLKMSRLAVFADVKESLDSLIVREKEHLRGLAGLIGRKPPAKRV